MNSSIVLRCHVAAYAEENAFFEQLVLDASVNFKKQLF